MRTLTIVCSTLLFLPLLSSDALANPTIQSQPEASVNSETETDLLEGESTFTAKNNGWNNSDRNEIEDVRLQLQNIRQRNFTPSRGIPSLTIANPYGFGSEGGFYSGLSYQFDNRNDGVDGDPNNADATAGFGMGFGNARKAVGAELSYTMASFGQTNRAFGSGGFNIKLHRQIAEGWGVAAGWNSFLTVGDGTDFDDSLYLSTTKVLKLRENVSSPFSRVALTAGIGNGQFRTEDDIADGNNSFNPFGSLAFRVARPVSFVTEWTGQDLAMGLSVSPIRTLPVTLNFGARDIAGAGDEVRLIFGIGTGF